MHFGPNLSGVFPTLEVAETLFVNAYLIATTTFAKAGKANLARYASEISGVEAQHLALARYAGNKLPNNLGFTDYSITSIDGIVAALEHAGVGFGKQGTAPGKFVSFAPPPPNTVTHVGHTAPCEHQPTRERNPMETKGIAPITPDDVQALEHVLDDTATGGVTRRMLIGRAAATAAIVSAAAPAAALAQSAGSPVSQIVDTAVTAEALAVTYLTGLIEHASQTGVSKFVDVLKAANAAEYDHYKALISLGAKPITTKFWAPDAFFKPGAPFKVLELAETLFVDAYLIATTAFANAGKADLARYAAEIGGVEAAASGARAVRRNAVCPTTGPSRATRLRTSAGSSPRWRRQASGLASRRYAGQVL